MRTHSFTKTNTLLSMIFVLLLSIVLVGCASKEDKEAAANVDSMISEAYENGGDVSNVVKSYEALSDSQRKLIKNNDKYEEISAANEVLVLIDKSKTPSQSEFDNILTHYNELSDSQKKIAKVDDYIEKYRDTDLNTIIRLEEEISKLSPDSPYSDAKPLLAEFNSLSDREKAIISNKNVLEEMCQLTEWDKAGIAAVKFLQSVLKDPSSLELKSLRVIKNGFYYVVVNYNAKNSFGGSQGGALCIDINSEFDTGLIGLSLLTGKLEASSNLNYQFYIQHNDDEIDLDPDKIMDNLDANLNE